jgi:glycine hydroxymethyltransferase
MPSSQAGTSLDVTRSFFDRTLEDLDPPTAAAMEGERWREQTQIELIASENFASPAVLEAQGSVLTNKYAEGYPGRRYYGGCEFVDVVEQLAIDRAKRLFGCAFANVQPHSGASANLAVFLALLQPGDTILGMSLAAGGHLSHGAPPNISGKWFEAMSYGVRPDDQRIDFDDVAELAEHYRPKLIIAGGSAYPRVVDFARFRAIADAVGAYLMIDMAHIAGLVAAGVHPSPFPHAHAVTSTTHKTLRGPRGGLILADDPELGRRLNSATFPGLQGGPLMHVVAAKAVAFEEALRPDFKIYGRKVLDNARALAEAMVAGGLDLVAGGTDTHLVLVDLRPKGLTGKAVAASLERAGITCNMNSIPFDSEKRTVTSGIRLGSAAATTRGFGIAEFQQTGRLIVEVLDGLQASPEDNHAAEDRARPQVEELCAAFPIYQVAQADTRFASGDRLVGSTDWRQLRDAQRPADAFGESDPTHLPVV